MKGIVSVACVFILCILCMKLGGALSPTYNALLFVYNIFTDLLTPASLVLTLNEVNLPIQFATVVHVVVAAAIENYGPDRLC